MNESLQIREQQLFDEHARQIHVDTDRLFAVLMVIQWLFGIVVAQTISPRTWIGTQSEVHIHVWTAVLLGGLLPSFPLLLIWRRPGARVTRHVVGAAQLLVSGLLVHLTGGRIETHFHVFGSLAFLMFYRDWKVLITASVVTAIDHVTRGLLWPESIYGISSTGIGRSIEHAAWVVFADIFFIRSCVAGVREMHAIARQRAELEDANERIEAKVAARTAELEETTHILQDHQRKLEDEVVERRRIEADLAIEVAASDLIQRATSVLAESRTLRSALTEVLQLICEATDWPIGHVYMTAVDGSRVLESTDIWSLPSEDAYSEFRRATLEARFPVGEGVPGRIFANGEPYCSANIQKDRNSPRAQAAARSGIKGGMGFPIKVGDEVTAVLEFFSDREVVPEDHTIAMLKSVGQQVGRVFERQRAEETTRKARLQAEEMNRDLVAVNEAYETLFRCETEKEVADLATQALVRQFDAYFGRVWLIRDADKCGQCALKDHCLSKERCLHLVASAGAYTNVDGLNSRVPIGAFKIGLIAEGRGRTISNDVVNDGRVHDRKWAAEHRLKSFAGIPLTCNGVAIGVIAMFSQEQLPDHRIDSLEILAKLCAAAIDNVRRIAELDNARLNAEQSSRVAQAANQTKSEFLANMSHEIRTPMTAILGYADILLEDGEINRAPERRVEAIQTIRRNGDHLIRLINDILDLSKIEAGKMQVERARVDPNALILESLDLVRVRADGKNLSLTLEWIGEVPATIETDPSRLRQILINMVGNAIKFTEQGGIRVVARYIDLEPVAQIQLDVIDTGIGIDEEAVTVLFEAFSQADNSMSRRFGGTGLGLAICRRLARILGGDVDLVETTPGLGTRFRITISAGPRDAIVLNPHAHSSDQAAATRSDHSGDLESCLKDLRILLAEDGPDNQKLISYMLARAGANVTVKGNGRLAYNAAISAHNEGTPFDVILMDMQMPEMDGYEATQKLRSEGYAGPIIALTAHAMEGERQKCIDAGCDDYETKPIKRAALLEAILRNHSVLAK